MDKLIQFLNGLPPAEQAAFAHACGTTVGYLRKAASKRQKLGDGLCINIERESRGVVRCEHLRADIDWAYLRGTNATGTQWRAAAEEAAMAAGPEGGAVGQGGAAVGG